MTRSGVRGLRRAAGMRPGGAAELTSAETWVDRHRATWTLVLVVAVLADQVLLWGRDPRRWDWLLVSGALLFTLAYPFTLSLPARAEDAVAHLVAGHGVNAGDDGAARLLAGLHRTARRAAIGFAAAAAGVLVLGWLVAKTSDVGSYALLVVLEAAGAWLVGLFIGRAVGYGRLGRMLTRQRIELTPRPGHLDGAAGLRPVGQLYIHNATLLAVVGVYLGVWWASFPHLSRYPDWRRPYALLLAFTVAAEVLVFVVPLLQFHTRMRAVKATLLRDADTMAAEVVRLRQQWFTEADETARDRLRQRMDFLTARYEEILAMPTWPVDPAVRRRFAVNNVAVLVPVVLESTSLPAWWVSLAKALGDAVTGGA